MSFENGGRPAGQASCRRPTRSAPARSSRSGPTPRCSRRPSSAPRRCIERLREMAFLNKGLEIRFNDERTDPVDGADLPVRQGRHRRLRAAPQRVEGADLQARRRRSRTSLGDVRGRRRDAVEHRLPRGHPLVREQHRDHRGRDARGGLQEGPHQRGQQVRPRHGLPQGEGRQPPRRGHPRGPHRDHLGEAAATRSSRARPRPSSATPRCARWSRRPRTRSSASGSRSTRPRRSRSWRRPLQAPRARMAAKSGARPHAAQERCSSRRPCRASSPTARRATRPSASCSSSRATAPAARPRTRAIPRIQAILPIRGKILNVERARMDKMLKNDEIQALITAIGAGIGEEFDVEKAALPPDHHPGRRRRRRLAHPHAAAHVLLPADAASSFERGYVYVAQPPLYSAVLGKDEDVPQGRGRAHACSSRRTRAASSRSAGSRASARWTAGARGRRRWTRRTRSLLQVSVEEAAIADEVFSILMGDDVESRRGFIQQNAKDVRFLDI